MAELFWELSTGAAGDMLLASLLAAGADEARLLEGLRGLQVSGWRLQTRRVQRCGIGGLQVLVEDLTHADAHTQAEHPEDPGDGEEDSCGGQGHPVAQGRIHPVPEHTGGHSHSRHAQAEQGCGHIGDLHHGKESGHSHDHAGAHRHLADLLAIVRDAPLPPRARERAQRVFRLLAEAEGRVHGKPPEEVHFHEISGIDTLIDVCGVCLALELLPVARIVASPVATGSGHVHCAHGILPVPAPATLEILQACRIPFCAGDVQKELLTPTGAALLGVLVDEFAPCPAGTVLACGYGAGGRDFASRANVVRAVLVESSDPAADCDQSAGGVLQDAVIEYRAVLDDATGEEAGRVLELCYAAGALEAYFLPAVMKKSRPGYELVILAPADACGGVEAAVFGSGLTLGMRKNRLQRVILPREQETVTLEGEPVRVKIGRHAGRVVFVKPEYDDCVRISEKTGIALREIRQRARAIISADRVE